MKMKSKDTLTVLDRKIEDLSRELGCDWFPIALAEHEITRSHLISTGKVKHLGRYHIKLRRDYRNENFEMFSAYIRTKQHLDFCQKGDRDWHQYIEKVTESFFTFEKLYSRKMKLEKIKSNLK
jgi:hypothetical protein